MNNEYYMKKALKEAEKAREKKEVPVGAVIASGGKIISRAHNLIRQKKDPAAHAEILALRKAAKKINSERLLNCVLYVNIEPCAMCAGAIILARVKKLVFGAKDPKTGACGSVFNIINNKKNNHHVEVISGVFEKKSGKMLKDFFREKRGR